MLVGHEPYFSNEIARLTGAKAKLRKGGLAIVDGNTLLALMRPDDLAAIAGRRGPTGPSPNRVVPRPLMGGEAAGARFSAIAFATRRIVYQTLTLKTELHHRCRSR